MLTVDLGAELVDHDGGDLGPGERVDLLHHLDLEARCVCALEAVQGEERGPNVLAEHVSEAAGVANLERKLPVFVHLAEREGARAARFAGQRRAVDELAHLALAQRDDRGVELLVVAAPLGDLVEDDLGRLGEHGLAGLADVLDRLLERHRCRRPS